MSETKKREINVRKDQMTIDEAGQVVVTDPEVLEAIQAAQIEEEGGWSLNLGCVILPSM